MDPFNYILDESNTDIHVLRGGGFVHHLQILNLNMNCYCLMNREKRKQLAHVVFQKMRYVKNGSNRNL